MYKKFRRGRGWLGRVGGLEPVRRPDPAAVRCPQQPPTGLSLRRQLRDWVGPDQHAYDAAGTGGSIIVTSTKVGPTRPRSTGTVRISAYVTYVLSAGGVTGQLPAREAHAERRGIQPVTSSRGFACGYNRPARGGRAPRSVRSHRTPLFVRCETCHAGLCGRAGRHQILTCHDRKSRKVTGPATGPCLSLGSREPPQRVLEGSPAMMLSCAAATAPKARNG
jgi:hypothetical protein